MNMVLVLIVIEPPLLLDGRDAYFYVSKTTLLLVHSSWVQCKQEPSAVAYAYIAWHASQTLILSEYFMSRGST